MQYRKMFYDNADLPKPLQEAELQHLLLRRDNGDINARNKIVEHNIRLVLSIIYEKYLESGNDVDDLVEIGMVGLIKAVDGYKITAEMNTPFSSYARVCIINEINQLFRKNKRTPNTQSLNEIIKEDGKNVLELADTLQNPEDIENQYIESEIQKINYETINKYLEKLSDFDRKIVELHFGFHNNKMKSKASIARELNVSVGTIDRHLENILIGLKKEFENRDDIAFRENKSELPVIKKENSPKDMEILIGKIAFVLLKDASIGLTREYYKKVSTIIENLSEDDREMVKLFFGFYNNECYTRQRISKILNIPHMTVYRHMSKILENLKLASKSVLSSDLESVSLNENICKSNEDSNTHISMKH